MKRIICMAISMLLIISLAACGEKTDLNNGDVITQQVNSDTLPENQQSTSRYAEDISAWTAIPDCFIGKYKNELSISSGKDTNGNDIWTVFNATVSITADSISVNIPEGNFVFTKNNSTLYLNNFLSVTLTDNSYGVILYDESNLKSGLQYINVGVYKNQNAVNQYLLYTEASLN